jgi:branched-subunit amino acid ABC-type transport system permease component
MSFLVLQATASGIVTGCVYALVALSLVIVCKSTDVVNFAGGELLMLGGYLGLLALIFFEVHYAERFVAVIAAMYVVALWCSTIPGLPRDTNNKAIGDCSIAAREIP